MFWTILLIALPILAGLGKWASVRYAPAKEDRWGRVAEKDYGALPFYVLGTFVAVGFIGFLFSMGITQNNRIEYTKTYELEALQDGSSIHGSFFLGIGTIDDDMKYHYYVKRDGAFWLEDVNPRYAGVVYTSGTPSLVEVWTKNPNSFWAWDVDPDHYIRQEFHVPEGSITKNYTLDAKD